MTTSELVLLRPFQIRNADEFLDENILELFVDPTSGVAGPFDYCNEIVKGKMGTGKTMYLRANYMYHLSVLVPQMMDRVPLVLPLYIKLSDFQNLHQPEKIYDNILNSVYTRSGQNSTPNSNATNLHSSQKRCCSFCISSSNASPTFQVQKSIFHQMTKPIQVTVILPLLLAISFSRNDDIHSSISGISNDLIGVIPTIGQ